MRKKKIQDFVILTGKKKLSNKNVTTWACTTTSWETLNRLVSSLWALNWQWMEWFKSWPDLFRKCDLTEQPDVDLQAGEGGREEGVTIDIQVEVREMVRGRCSLCQSWQIRQLPVRCGEEGRRGRRGRLKDPLQAGRKRRKRRRSLPKSVGRSSLCDGRSPRTLFYGWMISYLIRHRQADSTKASCISN